MKQDDIKLRISSRLNSIAYDKVVLGMNIEELSLKYKIPTSMVEESLTSELMLVVNTSSMVQTAINMHFIDVLHRRNQEVQDVY
jgi:hypothetical protein